MRTMLTSVLAMLCLTGLSGRPVWADSDPVRQTVTLEIGNVGETPMRCVVILAHFITRDVGPFAPGQSVSIEMGRTPAFGVLAYGEHNDRPMLVESVLCGDTEDWETRQAYLLLSPVRTGAALRYRATCGTAVRFSCPIETVADGN